MKIVRKLYEIEPISRNGEVIYEVVRKSENQPIGIAVACVEETKPHYHKRTNEFYIILEGRGEITLNGEKISVEKDSMVYIKPNTIHKAKNIGMDELKILVITFPPWDEKDHYEI
jgi:mannose-6-phosphate isomerase-like protein (cupin superfamily)